MDCSVVICTHNPRPDYFRRVLDALRAQSLAKAQWELLLIDNLSDERLAATWDLSWHPCARHVREEELGLTPARLRGIRESSSQLLVFVDDDNLLANDYLEKAITLGKQHDCIGAFGGSIKGVSEIPLPEWIWPYIEGLVICELSRDYWSNIESWSYATPYGAGLCVRRCVAEDYAKKVISTPIRKALGRSGTRLGAGEDTDLAWCAVDLGMGTGRFRALQLTHLIPKERLTKEYITRLYSGFAASAEILSALRSGEPASRESTWIQRARFLWSYLRASEIERRILLASRVARSRTRELLSDNSE